MRQSAIAAIVFALTSGCSAGEPDGEDLPVGQWSDLVAAEWKLEPGGEKYLCVRRTLAHAIDVGGFRPIAPAGTHHTVLSVTSEPGPDSVGPCSPAIEGHQIVFASGLGTSELALPEGVAATIPAGTRLLLNLHLANATPNPIEGRSAVSAFIVDPDHVQQDAEVILAGKIDGLEVVPGPSTQTGTCTFPAPSSVFALMPHMHARGRHLTVASGAALVYDRDFDVDAQAYTVLDPPLALGAGDALTVECGYDNPSIETLHYGGYATDEMCFAVLVRFPALGASPFCEN